MVYLFMQFHQECFRRRFVPAFTQHTCPSRSGCHLFQPLGIEFSVYIRYFELRKIRSECRTYSGRTRDEMSVMLVFDEIALGVDPKHGDPAVAVRLMHDACRFAQHGMFMFAAQIKRIAHPANVQPAALLKTDDIFHFQPLLRIGVFGFVRDEIGLGIEFYQIGNVAVVTSVTGNEPELCRKDTDVGF